VTDILAIDTHQAVLPTPGSPPAPGTAAWVTVRPHARRGAAVAADLLTALGKDLTWHGKGRNEHEDVQLAEAWITAMQVTGLVVANAQAAPLTTLDTLRDLAQRTSIDLWLLHRAPIDDRTLRKITKMATRPATMDQVPHPVPQAPPSQPPRPRSEPCEPDPLQPDPCGPGPQDVPFTSFLGFLVADPQLAPSLTAYATELATGTQAIAHGTSPRDAILRAVTRALRDASQPSELIARLKALQALAWRNDLHLDVDHHCLDASVERPRCASRELDQRLLAYRQPQRAITAALTHRGIPLDHISALTVAHAHHDGTLAPLPCPDPDSQALRLAVIAQRHLRHAQGAQPGDRLLAPDAKTLARFVNDATADLGINIAGRRVERQHDTIAWLKRLGITLKAL